MLPRGVAVVLGLTLGCALFLFWSALILSASRVCVFCGVSGITIVSLSGSAKPGMWTSRWMIFTGRGGAVGRRTLLAARGARISMGTTCTCRRDLSSSSCRLRSLALSRALSTVDCICCRCLSACSSCCRRTRSSCACSSCVKGACGSCVPLLRNKSASEEEGALFIAYTGQRKKVKPE